MPQVLEIPISSPGTCLLGSPVLSRGSQGTLPAPVYFCRCAACRQLETRWPHARRVSRIQTMPMVTVGTVKTASLEPLKGDTGLLKILTHGHSLTEDTDHLTSRPLKDKSEKHALKKEVPSPRILQLLGILQKCLENSSPAHFSSEAGERDDRLGVGGRISSSSPKHNAKQGHEQKPWQLHAELHTVFTGLGYHISGHPTQCKTPAIS